MSNHEYLQRSIEKLEMAVAQRLYAIEERIDNLVTFIENNNKLDCKEQKPTFPSSPLTPKQRAIRNQQLKQEVADAPVREEWRIDYSQMNHYYGKE